MPAPPTTLSDTELYSIQNGIMHGIRLDGRELREHRVLQISPPQDGEEQQEEEEEQQLAHSPSSCRTIGSSSFPVAKSQAPYSCTEGHRSSDVGSGVGGSEGGVSHSPEKAVGERKRIQGEENVGGKGEKKNGGDRRGKEMLPVVQVRLGDTLVMATASSSVFRDENWCDPEEEEEDGKWEEEAGDRPLQDGRNRAEGGTNSTEEKRGKEPMPSGSSCHGKGMLDITLSAVPRAMTEYASALIGGGGGKGKGFSGAAAWRSRYLLSTLAWTLRQVYGARQVRLMDSTLVDGAAVAEELPSEDPFPSKEGTPSSEGEGTKGESGHLFSSSSTTIPKKENTTTEEEDAAAGERGGRGRPLPHSLSASTFPSSFTPLSTGFPAEALYIDLGFAFHIRVDLVILESGGGNLLTALSTAVYTALQRLALPHVTLHKGPRGVVAEVDPRRCFTSKPIPPLEKHLSRVVVMCISPTRQYVVDPSWEEEVALPQQLHVGVDADGQLTFLRYQQWPSRRGSRRWKPVIASEVGGQQGQQQEQQVVEVGVKREEREQEDPREGKEGGAVVLGGGNEEEKERRTMNKKMKREAESERPDKNEEELEVGKEEEVHQEGEGKEEGKGEVGQQGGLVPHTTVMSPTTTIKSYVPVGNNDDDAIMVEGGKRRSHPHLNKGCLQGGALPLGVTDIIMTVSEAISHVEVAQWRVEKTREMRG